MPGEARADKSLETPRVVIRDSTHPPVAATIPNP
jgi:hypothetical protein